MGYLSKRRGVISVFLLMIFMVTYVFMGMLVDAGRYHMAQTYMESALDNASSSVLSNYNQLVFDLYGLFSTDIALEEGETLEEAIKEKYEHYLQETLSMVDAEAYETLLAELIDQNDTRATVSTQSLYDFEVTELNAGSSITLADTANVENQIIEYMKFRAPVALTEEMEGFLKKMQVIVEMKDRVEITLEKEKIKESYETEANGNVPLSKQGSQLISDINSFAGTLYNYTVTPHKDYGQLQADRAPSSSSVYNSNPFRIKDYATEFDSLLEEAEEVYRDEVRNEMRRYKNNLYDCLETLQNDMIDAEEDDVSTMIEVFFDGEYQVFVDMELPEELEELEELSAEVYEEIYSEGTDWSEAYIDEYLDEIERHERKLSDEKEEYEENLEEAKELLLANLLRMEGNAANLYEEARDLVSRIQSTVSRYESYVSDLKAKIESFRASGQYNIDENLESVYATEIELAEANMGELLKNLDLLANSRAYLDNLGYGIKDSAGNRNLLSDDMVNLAETIVNRWKENPGENTEETPLATLMQGNDHYKNARASENLYTQGYAVATIPLLSSSAEVVKKILPELQNSMCTLYSHVSYFYAGHYRQDVDVTVGEVENLWEENGGSGKAQEQLNENAQVEESVETAEGTTISLDSDKVKENPEMLKVTYSYISGREVEDVNAEISVDGEVTPGTLTRILESGLELINKLGDLLEGARDNLYVDVYVMSMFPNYKDHFKGYEDAKGSGVLSDDRIGYLASYAEVEFIITGAGANGRTAVSEDVFEDDADGFGNMSVWSMRTRLFGTRLLFNALSMLTDSAKLQQASALSAWAGPCAPLVSAILVICWIIAETVLDVMILMGDLDLPERAPNGEIPVFKQSRDWLFSLNGVASELGEFAIDTLSENLTNKAKELTESAESEINAMIYQAYNAANEGIDSANTAVNEAVAMGTERLEEWSSELGANLDRATEAAGASEQVRSELRGMTSRLDTVSGQLSNISAEGGELVEKAKTVTENAKEQAVLAVSRMSDKVMKTAETYIDSAQDSAKEFINNNITAVIPTGTVVNGGNAEIKMGYRDYLYFFLFVMNQETKIQRIQAVVQANVQNGGQDKFKMETAPVSVWADLECSMKYMFLSDMIVPEGIKKDGRLRVKVISAQSY